MQSSFSLEHKIAIVTGGNQGIGRAIVERFKAHGATVVNADLSAPESSVADLFVQTDVSSEPAVAALLEETAEEFGRIDVLVNNAGINPDYASIADATLDDFVRCFKVNTLGVAAGLKHAARHMTSGGSIINISSVLGLVGSPNSYGYVSSKFAVRGMTKAAAAEFGPAGVRVNSVHPGSIETEMARAAAADLDPDAPPPLVASIPLQRRALPEEVAQLALFLASDESSYCTGGEFVIDGGLLSALPLPRAAGN